MIFGSKRGSSFRAASVPTAFGIRVSETRDAASLSRSPLLVRRSWRAGRLPHRPPPPELLVRQLWGASSGVSNTDRDALLLPGALALHPLGQASPVLSLFASQILSFFFKVLRYSWFHSMLLISAVSTVTRVDIHSFSYSFPLRFVTGH